MQPLVRDLLAQGLSLEETHISRVFLGERDVWKVKKPVDFGFLDYGTLEKRRRACEAEVELNRRLSSEVYLGVIPVTIGPDGRHRLGGEGEALEWAVHMRRLPDAQRADRRLENGTLSLAHLRGLARRLADFHRSARCDAFTSSFGAPEAVTRNVMENFDQARACLPRVLDPRDAAELERRLSEFLRNKAGLFEARARAGQVRDGHGDLRLGQIYFDDSGQASILDCVEFNDRFRYVDVCADVAFLSMDLKAQGRPDLAENFLAAYAREAGDFDLYALADFYESYRACVRGKVACLRAAEADVDPGTRAGADAEAKRYFGLALAAARPPITKPRLWAVGGLPGSGKSTVSARLSEHFAVPWIASDRVRKHMAGLGPSEERREDAWQGLYAPDRTEAVYAEILRAARAVLESGRSVVVDATFRTRSQRAAAREAAVSVRASFRFVECRAPMEKLRERLRRRDGRPGISDAREDLLEAFARESEAPEELPAEEHVVADTGSDPEKTWERLQESFSIF